jgi:HK97 family phage major capsid protein
MLSPESRSDIRFDGVRRRVSLARIIERAAESRFFDGVEGEYLAEIARRDGNPFDQTRPVVDWELFCTRADTVGVAGQGGYLVGTSTSTAADALRPLTTAVALGPTVIEAKGSNLNVPKQTGAALAYYPLGETAQIAATGQTFAQLAMSPKNVGGYTEVSRQALLQSDIEDKLRRDLLAIIGHEVDRAAIHGTGIAGQPLGITNTPGVGSFSGTTLAAAGLVDAFVSLGDGLGVNGGIAANRTVAGTLRKRAEISGSGFTTWQGSLTDGTVVGYKARSSTAVAAGNLILGSWEQLMLAFWGGIELMVNPYGDTVNGPQNFAKGIVGIRAMASFDCGVLFPSAFTVATSVT